MIEGIQLKICGLTSLVDACHADHAGADYLGFILYPKSPRCVSLPQFAAMRGRLPDGRRTVAVMVEPADADLASAMAEGFDRVQIHFRADHPLDRLEAWSGRVGPERLWLAPKLPPAIDVADAWLPLADTFLLDSYDESQFGGSGRAGDWAKFRRHQMRHGQKTWILAGGIGPGNVAAALEASGARVVDMNSGVEVSPGIKDHAKIDRAALAIRSARRSKTR
ncbi:MAG: phosphoribosylanthranilate isomerase [Opitutaceae bacterium]|nr:phosphoribosylanthranilate isomerase [Opitutaceae bacterium]